MKTPEEIKKLGENLRIKIREGNEEATEYEIDCIVKGFILGYSGCQQDNAENKFTLDDMKKACAIGIDIVNKEGENNFQPFENLIKSLNKK